MDPESGSRKAFALLWAGAKLPELYGRPGDVSAVLEEGGNFGEGLFIAWPSPYLCYGAVERGNAPGVFAAAVGT